MTLNTKKIINTKAPGELRPATPPTEGRENHELSKNDGGGRNDVHRRDTASDHAVYRFIGRDCVLHF